MPTARLRASLLSLLLATAAVAQSGGHRVDTAAVIAAIQQRIAFTDRAQVGGVFIRMADQDKAQRIDPESPGPEDKLERYELYCDEDGTILGIGTFVTHNVEGLEESSTHYFDEAGRTIAIWWQLRWAGSKCGKGLTREVRYAYYHPADSLFKEVTTLTDEQGTDLTPSTCTYPEIERRFEAYLGREAFLQAKRITLE